MEKPGIKPKKVVFVNGVFDLIHPGHLQLLRFARSLGETLVVGINSDRAVKILKGPNRPINDENSRKLFLESLGWIDQVIIFDEPRTGDIVRKVKADVVVRGESKHTPEETRKIDDLPEHVEIVRFSKVGSFSTTNTIEKVLGKK